ncbi:MAG: hypothetical protein J5762_03910, partial [Clostridia bacterium]|nr:hypothetical protein [Clostridia bacterium]
DAPPRFFHFIDYRRRIQDDFLTPLPSALRVFKTTAIWVTVYRRIAVAIVITSGVIIFVFSYFIGDF